MSKNKKTDRINPTFPVRDSISEVKSSDYEKFKISYVKRNTKVCEFENLDKSSYKRCLTFFNTIGGTIDFDEIMNGTSYTIRPIKNSNNYKKYYKDLEDDVELFEVYLCGKNRLMWYIDPAYKIFYIVCYVAAHNETKKNYR